MGGHIEKLWDTTRSNGDAALEYCIGNLTFDSVIDIGCGNGRHSNLLKKAGKTVLSVDLTNSYEDAYVADYMSVPFPKADLIWCSHVLEHILNVQHFLQKTRNECSQYIAITVPPAKHNIVGGHVTIWNAGMVMYNLILAGYDCSEAKIKQCGYNITVIAKTRPISTLNLKYDNGDIETLKEWFPKGHDFHGFDGNIKELNIT